MDAIRSASFFICRASRMGSRRLLVNISHKRNVIANLSWSKAVQPLLNSTMITGGNCSCSGARNQIGQGDLGKRIKLTHKIHI